MLKVDAPTTPAPFPSQNRAREGGRPLFQTSELYIQEELESKPHWCLISSL